MRKILIFSLLLLIFLGSFSFVYAQEKEETATLSKFIGEVKVKPRSQPLANPAQPNMALYPGDEIVTGADGKAQITLFNGNVLTMKENSTLVLKKISRDTETEDYQNILDSNLGKIRAQVNKLKGASVFEIHTPVAVAAARGTVYYLEISPGVLLIFTDEGLVNLTSLESKMEMQISAGQACIYKDGQFGQPYTPSAEELEKLKQGYVIGEGGAAGYQPPPGEDTTGLTGTEETGDSSNQTAINDKQEENSGNNNSGQESQEDNDKDNDGLLNSVEATIGTDPENPDTDGDGLKDGEEVNNTYLGSYEDENGQNQSFAVKTDPLNPDSDGDDLNDGQEVSETLTNPAAKDTDGDGIRDRIELLRNAGLPKDADSDSDTLADGADLDENDDGLLDFDPRANYSDGQGQDLINAAIEKLDLMKSIAAELTEDQLDTYVANLERINDAQSGKVMTDIHGNRVRIDQYLFRPDSDEVRFVSLNLRNDGLSSLDLSLAFNQALPQDAENFRSLPWASYLSSIPVYVGDEPPEIYPLSTDLEIRNPQQDFIHEARALDDPHSWKLWFLTFWSQDTNAHTLTLGNKDYANVYDLKEHPVLPMLSEGDALASYQWGSGEGGLHLNADFHLIDDAGNAATFSAEERAFWQQRLRPLTLVRLIGANAAIPYNLEMIFSGAPEFQGRSIDVVIAPEIFANFIRPEEESEE
jgi:hypothetical protein